MTEKEKMLNGIPYKAFGEELFNERQCAKEMIFEYNMLHPSKIDERNQVIRKLFGKIGKGFFIEPPFRCDYGYNISIGNNVWIGGGVIINPNINIGDNVVIGSGSVVTKDIPSNSIAVGNPCRVIREITKRDKKYYFKSLQI